LSLPLLPREKIDDVRERTNLVEVVRRHVELKRAGTGSWKGLCPFHAEKTPSFHVHEQRQFFHCFGCGEKGDVFSFLTKIEQRSFMEVLRDLSQQAGVELPEKPLSPAERNAIAQAESERERMLRTMEIATSFFEAQLSGPGGAAARAYVASRGLGAEIGQRFRIGYAPASWDAFQKHLGAKQVPDTVAERLGLIGVGERGRYDFFRDRVMLPVLDRQRRPVGFSSRLLDPEAKDRKYLNSPDSPLFHKKENLYGLHAAQGAILRSRRAVIVEGNFDVLSLHDAGIEEAVAPMGTALTAEQVRMLTRAGARQLILVFDGDRAGKAAGEKAIPLLAELGLFDLDEDHDVRVARLSTGDPDDYVRREGMEKFKALLDGARPLLDHLIQLAAADSSIPGRAAAVSRVVEVLARVGNPIYRDLYLRQLAGSLGIPVSQIVQMMRGATVPSKKATESGASVQAVSTTHRTPPKEELEALVLLATHPELAPLPEAQRVLELLVDPGVRQIFRMALEALRRGERVDVPAWLDAGPPEVRQAVGGALMQGGYEGSEGVDRALRALVARLELSRVAAEIQEMKSARHQALERGDAEAAREISKRELELIRTKEGLSHALARP
jgi:DNA primase